MRLQYFIHSCWIMRNSAWHKLPLNNSFFLTLVKKRICINKLVSLIWCCSFVFYQHAQLIKEIVWHAFPLTKPTRTLWSRVHWARNIAIAVRPAFDIRWRRQVPLSLSVCYIDSAHVDESTCSFEIKEL